MEHFRLRLEANDLDANSWTGFFGGAATNECRWVMSLCLLPAETSQAMLHSFVQPSITPRTTLCRRSTARGTSGQPDCVVPCTILRRDRPSSCGRPMKFRHAQINVADGVGFHTWTCRYKGCFLEMSGQFTRKKRGCRRETLVARFPASAKLHRLSLSLA